MKLAHAVFVYPRLELRYLREWLDYHERMGVDHVFMTLHINSPRDKILPERSIVWRKKPNVPYVMNYTEDELVALLKQGIADHIARGRITFREAHRCLDKTGKSHRTDQVRSYNWAADVLRGYDKSEWGWMVVGDVDEFFVPVDQTLTLKTMMERLAKSYPRVGEYRCRCVIHPSRYDTENLLWDKYTPVAGQRHAVSKYICHVHRVRRTNIHYAKGAPGFRPTFNPPFYVHHFRGFDKYAIIPYGWPTEKHREYVTKEPGAPYNIRHTL